LIRVVVTIVTINPDDQVRPVLTMGVWLIVNRKQLILK